MNQSELAALKEQIKAELLQEMSKVPKARLPRPWDEVKESFLPRIAHNDPYVVDANIKLIHFWGKR